MMVHKVTYESYFSEEEVTETLYFNIRFSEIQNMIMNEGWDKKLQWFGEEFDIENMDHRRRVLEFWDEVIKRSYGVRDGDDFVQDPEVTRRFMRSAAYDRLIVDILYTSDSNLASEFIQRLFPKKLMDEINQRMGNQKVDPEELSEIEQKLKNLSDD